MRIKGNLNYGDATGLQVGLLNVDGYYNSLLAFMDKAVDEGFVTPAARHIIVSAHTAQDLMCKLEVNINNNNNNNSNDNNNFPIFTLDEWNVHISYYICTRGTTGWAQFHLNWFEPLICYIEQEYVPKHCGVAPKLSWEMEQQLVNTAKSDISRWLNPIFYKYTTNPPSNTVDRVYNYNLNLKVNVN